MRGREGISGLALAYTIKTVFIACIVQVLLTSLPCILMRLTFATVSIIPILTPSSPTVTNITQQFDQTGIKAKQKLKANTLVTSTRLQLYLKQGKRNIQYKGNSEDDNMIIYLKTMQREVYSTISSRGLWFCYSDILSWVKGLINLLDYFNDEQLSSKNVRCFFQLVRHKL